VLIGLTAASVAPPLATPVSSSMAPVLTLANAVSSILQKDVIATPAWGRWASLGAVFFVGLYLMLVLPQMSVGLGLATSLALLASLIGTYFGLLLGTATWVQLMGAACLLVLGHLVLTAKHLVQTTPGSGTADLHSSESNLMLGLALQGQGKLDLAFEKFCKCPMNDGLMETMYNLALDCERKQLFKKAEEIFRTMADFNPKFRDLKLRLALSKQAAQTGGQRTVLPPSENTTPAKHDGPLEKPMLGRYQLEKEIGKGAMGVVYLGRDAKIGRVAAIKTMALAQSFDESDLADVKQRFFREAETAGRLNHPNIVTIYEAGEERDLAYIAMEFLKGHDLEPMSKAGALLPLPQLLSIAARIADALDYAHSQQVVHRDIKPANIMYEVERDLVKVTDFGIARITDSSRTKTGMVLGTPSYMSPEQLLGKKVDGRSDLFSLGVMLYQMSCGQLPFVGDSLAQLMSKITKEAPTDLLSINPSLPAGVVAVLNKALSKSPEGRYQRGAEMAADLRACLDKVSA
jgi:eukaryotic-like serine/threonine-protein kinase